MKRLIIAEKPSLARSIMRALEKTGENFSSREDNEYFESEHYFCTAQFGHLLELKMPEEYEGRADLGSWRLENLPFYPKKYEYKIRQDAKKRFDTIGKLLKRSDVGSVYHAGDPAREGEILINLVLREHGNTKPVMRPWWKATTEEALLDAFQNAKPDKAYVNVFNEGMTRLCYDWDYGINLSQYATIKTGARPALNVGRVIGAIVNEIYNRDIEIENFEPEEYFKVVSDIEGGFKLVSRERFEGDGRKERATEWAARLQGEDSVVTNIEEKKVTKQPPKLFSQTDLQSAMSKRFNYSPEKTLQLSQSLYEKGLTTYPRTNTEYLAEDEKDDVRRIIDKINAKGLLEFKDKKSIFDNSKIEDHSAIIVTGKHPSSSGLSEEEMNCYKVILYRFMAVFAKDPCIYNKTVVTIDNPHEQFKVTGEVLVQEGWQKFEPKKKNAEKEGTTPEDEDDERTLPKVSVGDIVETDFRAVAAMTKPPAHYSVTTLNSWMKNPFKKEDSTDEEDYKNILAGLQVGTEATRAPTVAKAISKGYISLRKKAYYIEPRGKFLVESCRALGIDFSAKMTADMGRKLKAVGRGNMGVMAVLNEGRAEVSRIISEDRDVGQDSASSGGMGDYVPKEKTEPGVYLPTGETISFSKTWGDHTFTEDEIKRLLAGKEISFEAVSSKGNPYTATGSLAKLQYRQKQGRKVVRSWEAWGFALNEREFPESWGGHTFTEYEKAILLQNCKKDERMIFVEDLWSEKKNKTYSAHLVWNKNKRRIEPVFKKK